MLTVIFALAIVLLGVGAAELVRSTCRRQLSASVAAAIVPTADETPAAAVAAPATKAA